MADEISTVELTEADFPKIQKEIERRGKGEVILSNTGGEQALYERVLDELPKALSDRLRRITPPDFEVAEMEMELLVKGSPFGVGVGGKVKVKLRPRVGDD